MPVIIHSTDAAGIRGKKLIEVAAGTTIGQALVDNFEPGFNGVAKDLYLNTLAGKPLTVAAGEYELQDNDVLYVVTRQMGGVDVGIGDLFYPTASLSFRAGTAAAGKVFNWLYPLPDIPDYGGGSQKNSPNNSFTAQSNSPRPFQAIPELFGEGVAYPDIIQTAEAEYINNRRNLRELFCLGVGEYTINTMRNGDTNIDDIAGYTATVYGPGTYPTNLNSFRTAVDVDGQELIAPDDPTRQSDSRGVFVNTTGSITRPSVTFSATGDTITFTDYTAFRELLLEVGESLTVSGTASNNGTYSVTDINYTVGTDIVVISVSGSLSNETTSATLSSGNSGNFIFWFDPAAEDNLSLQAGAGFSIAGTTANDAEYTATSVTQHIDLEYGDCIIIGVSDTLTDEDDADASLSTVGFDDPWVGWFILNGFGNLVRIFLQMPRGVRDDEGNEITVSGTVEIEATFADGTPLPGGASYTINWSFTGATADAQYKSFDQSVIPGYYRARARRTTTAFTNAADLVSWEQAAMLSPYSGANFGNVTVIDVQRRANNFTLGTGSDNKFNVDYVRKLPDWTPGGGYDATLTEARNGFRAVLYQHVVAGGYPLAQLDVEELYDIYDRIGPDLGQFSASLDDEDLSHSDRMALICDAARILTYRNGQLWSFWRDELNSTVSASFGIRNTTGNASQTHSYFLPADYDSVEIQYRNPVTNDLDTIQRRIDTATGAIINGELGANTNTINLIGCRNSTMATNRADFEIRKLKYRRYTVSDEVLYDWKYVYPGMTVQWADIYDSDIMSGEILEIDGSVYRTSERLVFADGITYFGRINDAAGQQSAPAAITRIDDFHFSAVFDVAGFVANPPAMQTGSNYIIGSDGDMNYSLFTLLQRNPSGNSTATVQLVNYSPLIYEND